MKKVISLVLCLMLVMSLATSAFAAEVDNQTSHSYLAYQIFTGTQAAGGAELGKVEWGNGVDGDELLAALKAANPTLYVKMVDGVDVIQSAADVAACLQADSAGAHRKADAEQFANIAVNHSAGAGIAIAANAASVDLPTGYYLLVDTTDVDGTTDAKNPALLQVTNVGKVTITKKYDVPKPDKNIISFDDQGDHNHTKVEDYAIGDSIDFHLKATVPAKLSDYDQYRLVFHDDLSDGLTLTESSIQVGISKVVDGQNVNVTVDPQYYTIVTEPTCTHTGRKCDFQVVIPDALLIPEFAAGCNVVVAYKAVLNKDALIDTANPNHYALEFSNDPNWEPPTTEPGETPPTPPTGITPWVEVEVYTTQVNLEKVDGMTDKPLTGAEFTLTGTKTNIVKTTTNQYVEATDGTYYKLLDGTYTTTAPTTETAELYASTDVKYKNETVTEFLGKDQTKTEIKAMVGDDGKLSFAGLAEGTYTITESVVPGGYNQIEDITLTVTFDENTETYSYFWDGGATGTTNTIVVENNKGSVLPETGGMGTTLFYIVGSLMFVGAGVLLVTKKRIAE